MVNVTNTSRPIYIGFYSTQLVFGFTETTNCKRISRFYTFHDNLSWISVFVENSSWHSVVQNGQLYKNVTTYKKKITKTSLPRKRSLNTFTRFNENSEVNACSNVSSECFFSLFNF